VNRPCVKEAS